MKVKTRCEHCGKIYNMDDSYLGKTAQCKNCQNYFTMAIFEEAAPAGPGSQPPAATRTPAYNQPQGPPSQPPQPAYGHPPQPAYGQPPQPAYGQPPQPAYGQPQASRPLQTPTQTVVCPKCKFTADIPPVTRKLKLRCQECGHRFLVKPEPKSKPGRPLPTEKAPRERGGSSKAAGFLLGLILLAAAVLVAGPSLFPDLFRDLGLPNLLDLLPF